MTTPTLHQTVRSLLTTIIEHGPRLPVEVLDAARVVSSAMERDRKAKRSSQSQANVGRKPHPQRAECEALLSQGLTPAEVSRQTGVPATTIRGWSRP
jgi:hypothetical protein